MVEGPSKQVNQRVHLFFQRGRLMRPRDSPLHPETKSEMEVLARNPREEREREGRREVGQRRRDKE